MTFYPPLFKLKLHFWCFKRKLKRSISLNYLRLASEILFCYCLLIWDHSSGHSCIYLYDMGALFWSPAWRFKWSILIIQSGLSLPLTEPMVKIAMEIQELRSRKGVLSYWLKWVKSCVIKKVDFSSNLCAFTIEGALKE